MVVDVVVADVVVVGAVVKVEELPFCVEAAAAVAVSATTDECVVGDKLDGFVVVVFLRNEYGQRVWPRDSFSAFASTRRPVAVDDDGDGGGEYSVGRTNDT